MRAPRATCQLRLPHLFSGLDTSGSRVTFLTRWRGWRKKRLCPDCRQLAVPPYAATRAILFAMTTPRLNADFEQRVVLAPPREEDWASSSVPGVTRPSPGRKAR